MRVELSIAFLLLGGVALAAEPSAERKPAPKHAPAPKASAARTTALNLGVGNVRNYMMPHEFRQAVNAPDPDKNTVIVEADRVLLPMKSQQPVPDGLIAPFWAVANPLQAWRVLVPDPKRGPAGPPEVVPPPPFRWGP